MIEKPLLEAGEELVIIRPQSGNIFYDMLGRRLERACREVSLSATGYSAAEVCVMEEGRLTDKTVAMVQPAQCYFRMREKHRLSQRIAEARSRIAVVAESVETEYFENQFKVPLSFDVLLDVGFVSQEDKVRLLEGFEVPYRFLQHGPTLEDKQRLEQTRVSGREIPWATVGHNRPERSRLTRDLMRSLDPGGFAFLPPEGLLVGEGNGMIGPEALDALLQKTRYYVWESLHEHAYYESFRFREAILAGAVPCKIDATAALRTWGASAIPGVFPSVEALAETVREQGFEAMREAATNFYLSRGLLSEHLREALRSA